MFLKVVLVSCYQIVLMPKIYIWKAKYTIQQRIERSQTTKCIQYNVHVTKACELPELIVLVSAGGSRV